MIAEFAGEEGVEEFGSGIAVFCNEFIFVVHGAEDIWFGAVGWDCSPGVDS